MQPFDRRLNHAFVAPAQEPVGGRAVEEVVLSGSFPSEMRGVMRIDPNRPTARAA